ncbi:diguanylate cyclase (GGDEF)-like protein [Paraburkholderia sp. GAS199]|uniref:diguanylate cyclase domain-containing protein n=1 Tax=Paraburkholderia sp. GAS199 TaxID=3035126 RepID=UPI003D1EE008
MATKASKISTPTPEPRAARAVRARHLATRLRPGPTALAGASLLCLVIGLLYVALQIRTIFSDQIKQEYAGLVLEAADRAQSAHELAGIWQRLPHENAAIADGYRQSRVELANRIKSLAAIIGASPFGAPPVAPRVLGAEADLTETGAALGAITAYWRARRDADNADARQRIAHVADTLIALAALVFCTLFMALAMYARRTRLLKGQSSEFEYASLHDPMTGLPNRRMLLAALEEAALRRSASATIRKIAVLYIDLDGFKQVNDTLGHRFGDEFLIGVSRCFRESVRKSDVVARIGGDEFAVLVREFSTQEELAEIAQRLIECVVRTDEQMQIQTVRASVGIASFPDLVEDYQRLVAAADDAMYHVKRNGKNGYAFVTRAQ